MNEPKVTDPDYINFLVAAPRVVSCAEAARVQPDGPRRAAHDALNRLLHRLEPDPTPLWREAELLLDRCGDARDYTNQRRVAPRRVRRAGCQSGQDNSGDISAS